MNNEELALDLLVEVGGSYGGVLVNDGSANREIGLRVGHWIVRSAGI